MANVSLIVGESGTGKSTAIRTLDPASTFIVNVLNKPLPFKGFKKNYTTVTPDAKSGNYYASNNYQNITLTINKINAFRPEITTLIVDDFIYLMIKNFMDKVTDKGFDKFSEMAKNANSFLELLPTLRDDLDIFVLTHSEAGDSGKMKVKTLGKLIGEKISIEGMYTMLLQTELTEDGYFFITQGDHGHIAKSPMGMFESRTIPNDLAFVKQRMNAYFNE